MAKTGKGSKKEQDMMQKDHKAMEKDKAMKKDHDTMAKGGTMTGKGMMMGADMPQMPKKNMPSKQRKTPQNRKGR